MKKLALLAIAALTVALGVAAFAFAAGQDGGAPESVSYIPWDAKNKPACPAGSNYSVKVDPVESGTYGPVSVTVSGDSFSWAILPEYLNVYDMAVVMVKGGPSQVKQYWYDWDYVISYDDWSTGLTAADNPNSGKPYGLSHALFCFDPKGGGTKPIPA